MVNETGRAEEQLKRIRPQRTLFQPDYGPQSTRSGEENPDFRPRIQPRLKADPAVQEANRARMHAVNAQHRRNHGLEPHEDDVDATLVQTGRNVMGRSGEEGEFVGSDMSGEGEAEGGEEDKEGEEVDGGVVGDASEGEGEDDDGNGREDGSGKEREDGTEDEEEDEDYGEEEGDGESREDDDDEIVVAMQPSSRSPQRSTAATASPSQALRRSDHATQHDSSLAPAEAAENNVHRPARRNAIAPTSPLLLSGSGRRRMLDHGDMRAAREVRSRNAQASLPQESSDDDDDDSADEDEIGSIAPAMRNKPTSPSPSSRAAHGAEPSKRQPVKPKGASEDEESSRIKQSKLTSNKVTKQPAQQPHHRQRAGAFSPTPFNATAQALHAAQNPAQPPTKKKRTREHKHRHASASSPEVSDSSNDGKGGLQKFDAVPPPPRTGKGAMSEKGKGQAKARASAPDGEAELPLELVGMTERRTESLASSRPSRPPLPLYENDDSDEHEQEGDEEDEDEEPDASPVRKPTRKSTGSSARKSTGSSAALESASKPTTNSTSKHTRKPAHKATTSTTNSGTWHRISEIVDHDSALQNFQVKWAGKDPKTGKAWGQSWVQRRALKEGIVEQYLLEMDLVEEETGDERGGGGERGASGRSMGTEEEEEEEEE